MFNCYCSADGPPFTTTNRGAGWRFYSIFSQDAGAPTSLCVASAARLYMCPIQNGHFLGKIFCYCSTRNPLLVCGPHVGCKVKQSSAAEKLVFSIVAACATAEYIASILLKAPFLPSFPLLLLGLAIIYPQPTLSLDKAVIQTWSLKQICSLKNRTFWSRCTTG